MARLTEIFRQEDARRAAERTRQDAAKARQEAEAKRQTAFVEQQRQAQLRRDAALQAEVDKKETMVAGNRELYFQSPASYFFHAIAERVGEELETNIESDGSYSKSLTWDKRTISSKYLGSYISPRRDLHAYTKYKETYSAKRIRVTVTSCEQMVISGRRKYRISRRDVPNEEKLDEIFGSAYLEPEGLKWKETVDGPDEYAAHPSSEYSN